MGILNLMKHWKICWEHAYVTSHIWLQYLLSAANKTGVAISVYMILKKVSFVKVIKMNFPSWNQMSNIHQMVLKLCEIP